MYLQTYNKITSTYKISKTVTLDRADAKVFFIHFAIYSTAHCGQDWHLRSNEYADTPLYLENCFWILKNTHRIGGCVLYPNHLACFFLEPPFHDSNRIIKLLKALLFQWSDFAKPIFVVHVDNCYLNDFLMQGFRLNESRRWMLRPTEKLHVEWNDTFEIRVPSVDDKENIIQLLLKAYANGVDEQYHYSRTGSKYDYDYVLDSINEYFDESNTTYLPLFSSSSLIYTKDHKLIGLCLIARWKEWPLVFELATDPAYQQHGLGTKMLYRALNELHGEYPALRLFVTLGNKSESLYYKLGFMPGPSFTVLYVPANK